MEVLFGMVWLPFIFFLVCVPHCIPRVLVAKSDKWESGKRYVHVFARSIEGIFDDKIVGSICLLTLGCNFIPTF